MWTPYIEVVSDGEEPGEVLGSIDTSIKNLLTLQITALQDIAGSLQLLNARFEETFATGIDENDT